MTEQIIQHSATPLISVVIPVYKAEDCLSELYRRLVSSLNSISPDFEIIMVEDFGGDRSWEIIQKLAYRDSRVKGMQFSRNFGQHYAITAGLDFARGNWIVVMDCDLQDQPEEIPKLYAKAREGFEVVYARRVMRQDHLFKRWSSLLFYRVFDYLTDLKSDPAIANFGIYSFKVVEHIRLMRESARAFPLFVRWLGFSSTSVNVEHAPRLSGPSSYTFSKLMHLAMNVIIAQSNRPLRLSIKFGFLMALGSFLVAVYYTGRYMFYKIPISGWTSLIVSIYFLAGLFFINAGFIGLYIGRIYDEVKGRPLYVIREGINLSVRRQKDDVVNRENC